MWKIDIISLKQVPPFLRKIPKKSYLKISNYQFFFFLFIRIQRQGEVFLVVRFHVFSFIFSIIVVDFLSIVFFLDFLFEVVVLKLVIVVEELRDVGTVRSFFNVVISKWFWGSFSTWTTKTRNILCGLLFNITLTKINNSTSLSKFKKGLFEFWQIKHN